eukprot:Tbor_TRINITY_DN3756_c0_g1::TRINITY_DN3756_c0_g1_i1::g.2338::m.2338
MDSNQKSSEVNKLTGNLEDVETAEKRSSEALSHQKKRKEMWQERKDKNEMYQTQAYKLRKLHLSSASQRAGSGQGIDNVSKHTINPIWIDFPAKCTQKITSADELKNKLNYHTNSDEILAVRYTQNNCTACAALEKVYEYLCFEGKKHYPKLTFYEINKDENPELTKGMVRFPQIKAFAAGQWADIDYKPPQAFREKLYNQVQSEVKHRGDRNGEVITALQAEEMYFSAAGPSMLLVTEDSLTKFYTSAQVRLHNYWKQVSVRRSWFFKKYIEPNVDQEISDRFRLKSVLGEKVVYGPVLPPSEL